MTIFDRWRSIGCRLDVVGPGHSCCNSTVASPVERRNRIRRSSSAKRWPRRAWAVSFVSSRSTSLATGRHDSTWPSRSDESRSRSTSSRLTTRRSAGSVTDDEMPLRRRWAGRRPASTAPPTSPACRGGRTRSQLSSGPGHPQPPDPTVDERSLQIWCARSSQAGRVSKCSRSMSETRRSGVFAHRS